MRDDPLERLAAVRERIAVAADASGRDAAEVALLLATKTVATERILPVLRAGATLIGENRVQELVAKAEPLAGLPHVTHLIGPLQRNKVNAALRHADCIETIDSVELAEAVAARVPPELAPYDVMVQVNVSGEATKSGCEPGAAMDVVVAVAARPTLRLRGLMTVGLKSTDDRAVRAGYRRLRVLRDEVLASGVPGTASAWDLSMGMSDDLHLAIVEGATIVRVGSAVFGGRPVSEPRAARHD